MADVVVGFRELEHKSLDDIRAIADSTRLDFYCWDLYARVTRWYEEDEERLKLRAVALRDIEHDGTDAAAVAQFIAARIVGCHIRTMARLNIDYDLLAWEGHILRLQFWARAFEILKETGAVFLQTQGKLAGCWVMKIDDEPGIGDQGSRTGDSEESPVRPEEEEREKVIVRSNGTVTYVGKDIAYRSGSAARPRFFYRRSARLNGDVLWNVGRVDRRRSPALRRRGVHLQRH